MRAGTNVVTHTRRVVRGGALLLATDRGYSRLMVSAPVNIQQALASFDDIYSPRILGRVNDYDVRVAHAKGEHVWHVHDHTDEFFLVLEGDFEVSWREPDSGEHTVALRKGDMFVVPKGIEHKPSSSGGSILMFEPSGTLTTGDRHAGEIPGYVESTIGHELSTG